MSIVSQPSPAQGQYHREEPAMAQEDDIPTDDAGTEDDEAPAAAPAPDEAPDPEPKKTPPDPEKGGVPSPEQGKSEHPKQ